jgi:hypothetical protein
MREFNIDPLVKREIKYLLIGAITGLVLRQCIRLIITKIPVEKLNELEISKHNRKRRRILKLLRKLRGGQIGNVMLLLLQNIDKIGDAITILSTSGGFLAFLASLKKNQLVKVLGDASWSGVHEFALQAPNSGIAKLLKDITCLTTYELVRKVLEDNSIPVDKKAELIDRFLNEKVKKMRNNRNNNQVLFILCMVQFLMLFYLSPYHFHLFILLMEKLRELVLSGHISRAVYRAILRRLLKNDIAVHEYLNELNSM